MWQQTICNYKTLLASGSTLRTKFQLDPQNCGFPSQIIFCYVHSAHLQLTTSLSIWLLLINLTPSCSPKYIFSRNKFRLLKHATAFKMQDFPGLKCAAHAAAKLWNKFPIFCLIDQEKIFRICKKILLNPAP